MLAIQLSTLTCLGALPPEVGWGGVAGGETVAGAHRVGAQSIVGGGGDHAVAARVRRLVVGVVGQSPVLRMNTVRG